MTNHDYSRESAVIDDIRITNDDHGVWSTWCYMKLGDSGQQGFGGLCLGKAEESQRDSPYLQSYLRELCATFDVADIERLKGQRCFVLRNTRGWSGDIEGLEAPSGKRFTHAGWRRKTFPEKNVPTAREEARKRAADSVTYLERDLARAKSKLLTLDTEFVAWDE